jgi:hypothetical protein
MKAIINQNSMGIFLNGAFETITNDHPNYQKIRDALKNNDETQIHQLIDVKESLKQDGITEEDGSFYLYGEKLDNQLTKRVLDLRSEGFDTKNMVNFIKNIYKNPSKRAVDELYKFLEHYALPITEDGCFLAYKAVRNDYMDIFSGKIRNMVGDSPFMHRCKVDEDKEKHCSSGLHVGAIGYVKEYGNVHTKPTVENSGNRIMIVKVNPKDAVSVPSDCNCQKLRTCQYTVVSEMEDYDKVLEKALYTSDAEESTPTKQPDAPKKLSSEEDDSLYFDGRNDGKLDAAAGLSFQEANTDSVKYNRGYRNGYYSI